MATGEARTYLGRSRHLKLVAASKATEHYEDACLVAAQWGHPHQRRRSAALLAAIRDAHLFRILVHQALDLPAIRLSFEDHSRPGPRIVRDGQTRPALLAHADF
jgi:hypothetical protein